VREIQVPVESLDHVLPSAFVDQFERGANFYFVAHP